MSRSTTKPATSAEPIEPLVREFEQLLRETLAHVRRLSALAVERRELMRRADAAGLAQCIARENESVQALAGCEPTRMRLAARLAERLGGSEGTQTRVTWIASRLPGPLGHSLAESAEQIKSETRSLHRANDAARLSAERLAAHMQGLWRQAMHWLNQSRMYGRTGQIGPELAAASSLDVRT